MKLKSKISIFLAGVLVIFISGCNNSSQKSEEYIESSMFVKTEMVRSEEIFASISFSGRLEGKKDIMIMPQMPGEIEEILVGVNDYVLKGDLLVRMNAAVLEQTAAQYDAARKSYERMESLYADKLISPQAYDQAKAGYETAKAAYNQVLASTELRAPFSGTIVGKYFDEHDLYSPGRRGILRLSQIEILKLPITVVAKDYVKLSEGMEARIYVDVFPEHVFTGTLVELSPGADPVTGLFAGNIIINNPDGMLPVGIFTKADIIIDYSNKSLVIPRSALLPDGVVFIFKDDKAQRRVITTGIVLSDRIEVINGLDVGDLIIYEGVVGLEDGLSVKAVER